MLKIHRGFINSDSRFDFPHSVRRSTQHKFAFAPMLTEEDELLDDIDNSRTAAWELSDQPAGELEAFWDHVVADVRQDPEWNFASDD
jgi:hypothetical protein